MAKQAKKPFNRTIKWALLNIFGLLLALIALIFWVVGTETGTAEAWHLAQRFLPGSIAVKQVSGRLAGPLDVQGVHINTASMDLHIDHIHLDWQPKALLQRKLAVTELLVQGVDYIAGEAPPSDESKSSAELSLPKQIRLPLAVQLEQLRVADVAIIVENEPLVIDELQINDVALNNDQWQVGNLQVHAPWLTGHGQAHLQPKGQYALSTKLDATINWPDYAPIRADLSLTGDLTHLHLEHNIAAPYALHVQADTEKIDVKKLLQTQFEVKLAANGLDLAAINPDFPALAPIHTQINASGQINDLTLTQTAKAPYRSQTQLQLTDVLTQPHVRGDVQLKSIDLTKIDSGFPPLTINTTLDVQGSLEQLLAELSGDLTTPQGRLNVAATTQYQPDKITIEEFTAGRPEKPDEQLTIHGQIPLAANQKLNVLAQWQGLGWPWDDTPLYLSPAGQIQLTGDWDDYRLGGHLDWQVDALGQGQVALTGKGNLDSFSLDPLVITGDVGQLMADAQVAWAPQVDFQAHVESRDFNPALLAPNWPGNIDLNMQAQAQQQADGQWQAQLNDFVLSGQLKNHPIEAHADVDLQGHQVNVERLLFDYADNTATVNGQAGWQPDDPLNIKWDVKMRDLSALGPQLAGILTTQGRTAGTLAKPQVQAQLAAQDLVFFDNEITQAKLDAQLDWWGQNQLQFDVGQAYIADQVINQAQLFLTGSVEQHQLGLDVDAEDGQLHTKISGQLDRDDLDWQFTLEKLRLAYQELAPWQLKQPSRGQLSAQQQQLKNTCLAADQAQLCVQFKHNEQALDTQLAIQDLPLNYALDLIDVDFDLTGTLAATLDAHIPANASPMVHARINTTSGKLLQPDDTGKPQTVWKFSPLTSKLDVAKNHLAASLDWPVEKDGHIHGEVKTQGEGELLAQNLIGQWQINLPDLAFITKLSPEIATLDGQLNGEFNISGQLQRPQLLGELALTAQQIDLLTPGLSLSDVIIAAKGYSEQIRLQMQATSDEGRLAINGQAGLDPLALDLTVKGEDFQAANTPLIRAWISPDMTLKLTPEDVLVHGEITIPKARITPKNLAASGAETASDDVVFTDQEEQFSQKLNQAIEADVLAVLQDVTVDGYGLKTGIEGELRVRQSGGKEATGSGKLALVDGEYRAYGQNLDIQQGEIYFADGPLTNPGINLKAARYPANDIEVGVQARGPAKEPEVSLYSDPAMSQAEILSWLLLGQPLEGNSEGENNLLAQAALAIGGGRANEALDRVGNKLGLDDVGIGSAAGHESAEAAFMVGKYLTPKLYLSYGVGLFNPVNTLSLRYTLNSKWQLQSQSTGADTGADIIYTIER